MNDTVWHKARGVHVRCAAHHVVELAWFQATLVTDIPVEHEQELVPVHTAVQVLVHLRREEH